MLATTVLIYPLALLLSGISIPALVMNWSVFSIQVSPDSTHPIKFQ
jgi:hypothetical protein